MRCALKEGRSVKRRLLVNNAVVRTFGSAGSLTFHRKKVPKFLSQGAMTGASGKSASVAPMPGVVEKVFVKAGEEVKAGQPLVVMIAMKMEYVVKAPRDGTVEKVLHKAGDFVAKDTLLVKMEASPEDAE